MTSKAFTALLSEIESTLTTPKAHNRKRHDEYMKKIEDAISRIESEPLGVGNYVIRWMPYNMGTKKWPDMHWRIDWVRVDKITEKGVYEYNAYGKIVSRCPLDRIILVLKER